MVRQVNINLKQMSDDDKAIIAQLLRQNFPKHQRPEIFDDRIIARFISEDWSDSTSLNLNPKLSRQQRHRITYQGEEIDIKLSHSIIRSAGTESYFEIVEHNKAYELQPETIIPEQQAELGRGSYGKAKIAITRFLLPESGGPIVTSETDRVVKIQTFERRSSETEADFKLRVRRYLYRAMGEEALMRRIYPEVETSFIRAISENKVKLLTYMPNLGVSLSSVIKQWQKSDAPARDKLVLIQNLLLALKKLEANQIFHRDIKPDNILVNPETLEVNIIDFGLASPSTNTKGGPHTLLYINPESAFHGYNYSADMYSMAVVIHKVLTLEHYNPFLHEHYHLDLTRLGHRIADLQECTALQYHLPSPSEALDQNLRQVFNFLINPQHGPLTLVRHTRPSLDQFLGVVMGSIDELDAAKAPVEQVINVFSMNDDQKAMLMQLIDTHLLVSSSSEQAADVPQKRAELSPGKSYQIDYHGRTYQITLLQSVIQTDEPNWYQILPPQADSQPIRPAPYRLHYHTGAGAGAGAAEKSLQLVMERKRHYLSFARPAAMGAGADSLAAAKTEAELIGECHPPAPTIIQHGVADELGAYIDLPGLPLSECSDRFALLALDKKFAIYLNLLREVAKLQEKNIFHCGIKPEHLYVDTDTTEVRLTGFAFASKSADDFSKTADDFELQNICDPWLNHGHFDVSSHAYLIGRVLTNLIKLKDEYNPAHERALAILSNAMSSSAEARPDISDVIKQFEKLQKSVGLNRQKVESIIKPQSGKLRSANYFNCRVSDDFLLKEVLINYSKSQSVLPAISQFFTGRHHHHDQTIRAFLHRMGDHPVYLDDLVDALVEAENPVNPDGTMAEIIQIVAEATGRDDVTIAKINQAIAQKPIPGLGR